MHILPLTVGAFVGGAIVYLLKKDKKVIKNSNSKDKE